jgi:uncharacterized protein (TIGR03435 family)
MGYAGNDRRRWFHSTGLMVGCLLIATACKGQAPTSQSGEATSPKVEFEVASVRQNKSDDKPQSSFSLDSGNLYSTASGSDVFDPNGGYFSATNQPLWRYIVFAYKLSGTQELALRFNYFAGLASTVPDWVNSEHFDIKGRVAGNPGRDQMRIMMQALLAERFKLVVHKETRQAPVFALVLVKPGKMGPFLLPHSADESCAIPANGSTSPALSQTTDSAGFPFVCGVIAHLPPSVPGRTNFGARGVTLSLLATSLPTQTGMRTIPRPVIDETGLSGTFDFRIEWAPEYDSAVDVPGPTFSEALKSQLGLKLESRKGTIELVVIDHVERPVAN